MMNVTRRTVLVASVSSAAFAGCLGDDDGAGPGDAAGTDGEPNTSGSTDDAAGATVRVRTHDEHGDILVGPDGLTLYNFDSDERGEGESTCYDDCATNWPPLTVTDEPVAGDGVAAELTTFEREDGDVQVAAGGWPLYYFAQDEAPGDTAGQGVNDVWWILDPDGNPIRGGGSSDDNEDGPGY